MGGQPNPMRASRMPEPARAGGDDLSRRTHPLAPFLGLVGASLPWLVYDAFVGNPGDFWTWRGLVVIAAVSLGVVLVGISWHFSRGLAEREG